MALLENVTEILKKASQPYQAGRFVIVPTLLSYEGGRAVQTYIEGGAEHFLVSDGGSAAINFVTLGGAHLIAEKQVKSAAKNFGLRASKEGWIFSGQIPPQHLPTYIATVAECSLWADEVLRKIARRQAEAKDFKEEVNGELRREAPESVIRRKHLIGASNKQHVFDFAVDLGQERTLVVDAVVPDANSINSAVVSHLDLKHASNPRVIQRIVFDDRAKWSRADLALLAVGAPAVPFSLLRSAMGTLSHVH